MLFAKQNRLHKVWELMNASGLSNSPSDAESLLQQALDQSAQECDVNVSQLKYQAHQPGGKGSSSRSAFTSPAAGPLSTISRLLSHLETTPMPAADHRSQISPRKEGLDDLQLQLDVSTLCRVPDREKCRFAARRQRLGRHQGRSPVKNSSSQVLNELARNFAQRIV